MADHDGSSPAPGWYRESADSVGLRWWDGRGWTEHRRASASPAVIEQPPLPPGTRVNTVWVWLLSLMPLLALAAEQPVLLAFGPIIRQQAEMQRQLLAHPGSPVVLQAAAGDLAGLTAVSWGLSLLLIGIGAVLARLDWRALQRAGIVRPFSWGWGFLVGVYLVGRTVVLRRRVGRGLPPLILTVVLFVAAMLVQLGEFLTTVAQLGAGAG